MKTRPIGHRRRHLDCLDLAIGIGNVEFHLMWDNDGTNVFHFAYEDNSEDITLELFSRDHILIGISR